MSFKNLEQRFNENVKTLYAGATSKFENGKPSNGKNDDPLIVRAPGKGYWTKIENRGLPLSSALQDVKRITLFTLSTRGILFLAKQQLLQTGNTFEQTRLLNPLFAIGNAVPFLHVKRNLRPLGELIGKTDTSYENVKKLGQLQVSTFDKLTQKFDSNKSKFWKEIETKLQMEKPSTSNPLKSTATSKIKSLSNAVFSPIQNTLSAVRAKRNIGNKFGYPTADDPGGWSASRPELSSMLQIIDAANAQYFKEQETLSEAESSLTRPALGIDSPNPIISQPPGRSFIRYFNGGKGSIRTDSSAAELGSSTNARDVANPYKKVSYIQDTSNIEMQYPNPNISKTAYNTLDSNFDDPIVVSFAMGTDDPVRFRAYIRDLHQSATPEYKSYQYIGRMEKFVNYTGVQREISFKLGVIAFSKEEISGVWRRINYLTGLVFPYGVHKGIFQPNITKLTIGDVYTDQPGYITFLGTNFNELAESWEIDSGIQVPISAVMDIKFVIIEKSGLRTADSAFYGITETMDGFVPPALEELPPLPNPSKIQVPIVNRANPAALLGTPQNPLNPNRIVSNQSRILSVLSNTRIV